MKKTSTVSSFRTPNLLNIQEKRTPSFRIPFSNLPSAQRTPKSTNRNEFFSPVNYITSPRSTKTYPSPTKTKIFNTISSISEYYNVEPINQEVKNNFNCSSIFFSHPFEDSLLSSLTIVFVSSYFDFFSSFLNIYNEDGEINLEKAKTEIEKVTTDQLNNDISKFIMHIQSLSISIIGPMEFDSVLNLQVVMQAEFEKNHTEDMVISNKLTSIPPNTIKLKSNLVEKITGEDLYIEYKLRWAICIKNDQYFPVIFHDDFTCDVLYRTTYSYLFGSIGALYYSGAKILYVCYSLRDRSCPSIRLSNDST